MTREATKTFCENTTIHGLAHAVKQNSLPFRIFWISVVLIGFFGLSFHLYYIIDSFLQYKSTESIYEKGNGFRFPDVTICNYNGISYSNLEDAVRKNFSRSKYFYNEILKKSNNFPTSYVPVTKTSLFWALGDEARLVGHKRSDMILRCRFQRRSCTDEEIQLFNFYTYFNCYQIIAGRTAGLITNYGLGEGMSLILYMETGDFILNHEYDYNSVAGDATGFRMVINPSGYLAGVGNDAYDMNTGTSSSFGFFTTEQSRLPEPYSQCTETNQKRLGANIPYSFVECRNMCIHKVIWEKCGCDATIFVTRTIRNVTSCGEFLFTNKTKHDELMACQTKYMNVLTADDYNFQDACNCYSPCSDTSYQVTLSQSVWPDRDILGSFITHEVLGLPDRENTKAYKDYKKLTDNNATEDEIYEWVKAHFVRLTVFARSYIVKVRDQVPLYTATDLLCQIGGCMGLWVGMSVITIVEIFDLLVKAFFDCASVERKKM